jgi:hypothetical protein
MEFEYIKNTYKVPAEIGREVLFQGKRKGVIAEDKGNYIGVNFDDKKPGHIELLHPTWEVQYLETFAKIRPMSRSQQRYQDYLNADWFGGDYRDWIMSGR